MKSASRSSSSREPFFSTLRLAKRESGMYGSYAITRIAKPRARWDTSPPIRPSPMMPSVFAYSSLPSNCLRPHRPLLMKRSAQGMLRLLASRWPMVISAAETTLLSGVLQTMTPFSVAQGTEMLSRPDPARPTILSFTAASRSSLSMRVSLRTMMPSYSGMIARSSSRGRRYLISTWQAADKMPIACSSSSSATSTLASLRSPKTSSVCVGPRSA